MSAFASKAPASADKLRGGYYTPQPIAAFLAEWVAQAGPALLEPSCGDGSILGHTPSDADVVGVELIEAEARTAAAAAPWATVHTGDFFSWFDPSRHEAWDGVLGNPPFIRFQHWNEPSRGLALDLMRMIGLRPNKLTNAWVPFVVAGALALKPGGRLGLVVPAEVMQVTYAAELRAFLVDELEELTVATFRRLVFPTALQEVVLLLGVKGRGPARIRVVEFEDAQQLDGRHDLTAVPHAPALRHETEKWTKYFLEPEQISLLRAIRESGDLTRLGTLADVDVGVVTGRNRFFVMRPSASGERQVGSFTTPLVSKSAHLRGISFGDADLDGLRADDAACELLAIAPSHEPADALRDYIASGEDEEVHLGYKCRIRRRWWVVPSVWTPDAFLLRQIYDHPRLVANATGATSTDTVHRVRMLDGHAADRLAAALINSATFAIAEVVGRSYGGGVLELEPREAEQLLVPDPALLTAQDIADVDALVRGGSVEAAADVVDERVLIGRIGLSPADVRSLRAIWQRLKSRRLQRG